MQNTQATAKKQRRTKTKTCKATQHCAPIPLKQTKIQTNAKQTNATTAKDEEKKDLKLGNKTL